ncbi:MAG: hypothetical protein JXQ23_00885 [Clostridia bacterium]|nr:hypothetical protein [Clostridia bacterium]
MSIKTCPDCHEKVNGQERTCPYCGSLFSKVDKSYKKEVFFVPGEEEKRKPLEQLDYKICRHCESTNKLSSSVCRVCNQTLSDAVVSENDTDLVDSLIEKDSKKEKREQLFHIVYLAISFLLITFILIIDFSSVALMIYFAGLFLLGMAVMFFFYPDVAFFFSFYHFFVKDPEPSDFFYTTAKIAAFLYPAMAILLMIII